MTKAEGVEVIDRSYNQDTGELEQFTIIRPDGQPDLVKATPENTLLYDPEGELPFDNGLYEFLHGQHALVLSEDNPEVIIAPTSNDHCYILRVRGNTVETTPNQAEEVLRGVKEAATGNRDVTRLVNLYENIMANQVRRGVINALKSTFDEEERITVVSRGWLIDDFYLVNWEASMYVKHDDPDEPDYKRGGGGVTEVDRSHEFVQLDLRRDINPIEVSIAGESYKLTEREMLFLAKVKWLLNRRHYHPDMPFWKRADRYASVDHYTGEPEDEAEDEDEEDEEPDLDKFSL